MEQVAEHVEKLNIVVECVVPDHDPRVGESPVFDAAVKKLKEDGHWLCYICGGTDQMECHHFKCEKSRENIVDFDKLKAELMVHDIFGYSKAMAGLPITTVDDIRNQMPLCMAHHRGKGTGAHFLTEEDWIAQKICLVNPVPQAGETEADVMARVKEVERK